MSEPDAENVAAGTVGLVPLDRRHAEQTRAWANDPGLMRLLDRAWFVQDAEHERWFSGLQQSRECSYFAVEADSRHVGNVWLAGIDWRHRKAEVRIVLDPEFLGRGVGTEALRLVARHAFERLNLQRLYACVLQSNALAQAAFQKAGFAVEGLLKHDRWLDDHYEHVCLLGLLREQHS